MRLFEISSDSTCDLKKQYVQERGVWIAPLSFVVEKEGVLEEGVDDFACEEDYVAFYQKLQEGALSRTSMLNFEKHYEYFASLAKAGVKEVVHFTLSSGLSPTSMVAVKAAVAVKEEYPDFNAYVVDSLTATVGQGMLVEVACDCRDKGLSAQETYERLLDLCLHVQHCIIPHDLFYLRRGGRVSSVTAAVGTVLNIKPVLTFDASGKLQTVAKCKGIKMAYAKVVDSLKRAPLDDLQKITVVHTGNYKGAEELASLVEGCTGVKPAVTIMGPVIGSHVGPGSVSCAWISTCTRAQLNESAIK